MEYSFYLNKQLVLVTLPALQVFVNFPRPDVAQVYSHVPDAEMSGFETIVDIGELVEEGELLIQAVCSNKSCIPLKKVQFQVVAAEKQ